MLTDTLTGQTVHGETVTVSLCVSGHVTKMTVTSVGVEAFSIFAFSVSLSALELVVSKFT